MRDCVGRFLAAAVQTLQLEGPTAWLTGPDADGEAALALRRLLACETLVRCQLPAAALADEEIDLPHVPLAAESFGAVICLDLVRRLDEASGVLDVALAALAPGGMALMTVDTAGARPQAGLSRVLTPLGLERLVAGLDGAVVGWQGDADFPASLYLVACRPPAPPRFADSAGRFVDAFQQRAVASSRWRGGLYTLLLRFFRRRHAAVPSAPAQATCFSFHLPRCVDWKSALLANERTQAAE
ncbi:MAG: hypothetical protein HYX69_16410 [Planctomycetia bacterium]|nr:hypothetical protein [Planctomycetia bacterium]